MTASWKSHTLCIVVVRAVALIADSHYKVMIWRSNPGLRHYGCFVKELDFALL
jgi:hypothetical protein